MNWYVALAQTNAVVERDRPKDWHLPPQTVMERLEAIGAGVFYPKARIVRRRLCMRSRTESIETVWVPVFGRYVFARGEPGDIRAVRGIAHLINNADGVPGVISESLMEDMKTRYRNYKVELLKREMKFKRGQQVRIMEGPMRGWDAKVELVDLAKGLLTCVREAMGREIPIQNLRVEDVEAV